MYNYGTANYETARHWRQSGQLYTSRTVSWFQNYYWAGQSQINFVTPSQGVGLVIAARPAGGWIWSGTIWRGYRVENIYITGMVECASCCCETPAWVSSFQATCWPLLYLTLWTLTIIIVTIPPPQIGPMLQSVSVPVRASYACSISLVLNCCESSLAGFI